MSAAKWIERDRELCWHPYTQHATAPEPLPVVGAEGAWLELADGRRLLDAISSWWCILHGHGHPALRAAMLRQSERLDHVLFAGCSHEPAVALAEELVRLAPPGLRRVFYSDNGSTAVEVALKAAYLTWVRRGQPQRTRFLALDGSYHGDTFGAMSIGAAGFFDELGPLCFGVQAIPPDAEFLSRTLQTLGDRAAALVIEPLLQGAAGMRMYPPAFLRQARELCDEHGIFLIADEVLTGFGRTGRLFACEHAGIRPDLMALAKGLTGGTFPLAATLATEEIYAAFLGQERDRAFFHGHTFTANPVGCAIALASLELVRRERTPERLSTIGRRIAAGLEELDALPGVAEVRRLGGVVAVELAASDRGYLAALGDRLRSACRRLDDVLLRPLGNVLYAMPPSCTTASECDRIAGAMDRVVRSVLHPPAD